MKNYAPNFPRSFPKSFVSTIKQSIIEGLSVNNPLLPSNVREFDQTDMSQTDMLRNNKENYMLTKING